MPITYAIIVNFGALGGHLRRIITRQEGDGSFSSETLLPEVPIDAQGTIRFLVTQEKNYSRTVVYGVPLGVVGLGGRG